MLPSTYDVYYLFVHVILVLLLGKLEMIARMTHTDSEGLPSELESMIRRNHPNKENTWTKKINSLLQQWVQLYPWHCRKMGVSIKRPVFVQWESKTIKFIYFTYLRFCQIKKTQHKRCYWYYSIFRIDIWDIW